RERTPTPAECRSPVAGEKQPAPHFRKRTTSLLYCAVRDARRHREWEPRSAGARRTIPRSGRSGAWPLPFRAGRGRPRRGQLAALNRNQPVLDLVRIFEQAALRRTRGTRAVAVICSAMARAHEQTRLGKPANRTAEVRAVHGEDLEFITLDTPDPACGIHRL